MSRSLDLLGGGGSSLNENDKGGLRLRKDEVLQGGFKYALILDMKLTDKQYSKFLEDLKKYRSKYLKKHNLDADESATRIMINFLLSRVFGFEELEEIKTEFAIRGTYVDYLVQSKKKIHFIVEVKAISLNLNEKHLRQAIGYCANEGIEWVLLTNGRQFDFYRVIFGKPISYKRVFSYDITDIKEMKKAGECLQLLTKRLIEKGALDDYWKRFEAMQPTNLSKDLYSPEVLRFLKRNLKKKTNLTFSDEDILDSVFNIIIKKIESKKPSLQSIFKKK